MHPGLNAQVALAGGLRVHPGAPLGSSLLGTRPNWAPRLAQGQPVAALPGLMASLFNLCSHAHRLACQLAVDAALQGMVQGPLATGSPGHRPANAPPTPHATPATQVAQTLRIETAREHLRRMGLDWPRLLAPADHGPQGACAQAAAALKACPLLRSVAGTGPGTGTGDPWPATLAWLEAHWLHIPATAWLAQWCQGGGDWLAEWSGALAPVHPGGLPALVKAAQPGPGHTSRPCHRPLAPAAALPLPVAPASQAALAQALASQPDFARQPQWQGACAHTGSWTRWRDTEWTAPTAPELIPWALLGSRIAELVRLCLPDDPDHAPGQGSQWLAWGAAPTAPGQALAWVEMARGVLLYRVAVDTTARAAGPKVVACEVLAPTEWNFHPQGEVARRLSALDPQAPAAQTQRDVHRLMAAFDPCVPFELPMASSATHLQETIHA